jgi:MoxR-like ATPase
MEEQTISVEGKTYQLPEPFFVIATQNPSHQIGTFPLPESQLDRFLMRLELGYPNQESERLLLQGQNRRSLINSLPVKLPPEQLLIMQNKVSEVYASNAVLDYCQAIISYTRESSDYQYGLSPRAGLALLNAAKAWAFLDKRDAVIPEDIQAVLAAVAGHRLKSGNNDSTAIVAPILAKVAVQ